MNVERAFRFVFDDPRWLSKVLIGGVLLIVPIIGQLIVMGYSLRLLKHVTEGYDTPLPEWEDFGGLFMLGLKSFIATFVWALPVLGIVVIGALLSGASNSDGVMVLAVMAAIAYALLLVLVGPAIQARVALTDSAEAGLDYRQILGVVRANPADYLLLVALGIVTGLIGSAGAIVFGIGWLLTMPYSMLVIAHLWGQAWYRSTVQIPSVGPANLPPLEP